jgi:hypothetical protein
MAAKRWGRPEGELAERSFQEYFAPVILVTLGVTSTSEGIWPERWVVKDPSRTSRRAYAASTPDRCSELQTFRMSMKRRAAAFK